MPEFELYHYQGSELTKMPDAPQPIKYSAKEPPEVNAHSHLYINENIMIYLPKTTVAMRNKILHVFKITGSAFDDGYKNYFNIEAID